MTQFLSTGRIVWATIPDANGIQKLRPAVVVKAADPPDATGRCDVVAVTSRLLDPLPDDHVLASARPPAYAAESTMRGRMFVAGSDCGQRHPGPGRYRPDTDHGNDSGQGRSSGATDSPSDGRRRRRNATFSRHANRASTEPRRRRCARFPWRKRLTRSLLRPSDCLGSMPLTTNVRRPRDWQTRPRTWAFRISHPRYCKLRAPCGKWRRWIHRNFGERGKA